MEKKLLDLNAYGVNKMSGAEMREVKGGWKLTRYCIPPGPNHGLRGGPGAVEPPKPLGLIDNLQCYTVLVSAVS